MAVVFCFNDTATTEIYTLSLHDALPICGARRGERERVRVRVRRDGAKVGRARPEAPARPTDGRPPTSSPTPPAERSEEHTSELQSRQYLVCRLLLEKKTNHNAYPVPLSD